MVVQLPWRHCSPEPTGLCKPSWKGWRPSRRQAWPRSVWSKCGQSWACRRSGLKEGMLSCKGRSQRTVHPPPPLCKRWTQSHTSKRKDFAPTVSLEICIGNIPWRWYISKHAESTKRQYHCVVSYKGSETPLISQSTEIFTLSIAWCQGFWVFGHT